MKMLLPGMVLLAATVLADSIPSRWIVLKDRTNKCQIAVPRDFKRDPASVGLAKGPGNTVEVQIYSAEGPVTALSPMAVSGLAIEKLIENTDERQFYANKPTRIKGGRIVVGWTVKIPREGGNCFASITVTAGSPEDLVRKIANTISVTK
jgi:hypothetical protein